MKPLIVMGMGRSGTRYFADIISSHNEVVLCGEIPHSAMSSFFKLLEILDEEHGREKARLRKWNEKKANFIFEAFSSMAMGHASPFESCKHVGHKTPRSERFFDLYEKHFASSGLKPNYFYCIRSPFDVWVSFKNMPWNTYESVESFVSDYVSSYKRYVRAKRRAEGRVYMLNLEAYKESENLQSFLKENVFDNLGLTLEDGFLESLIGKENTNSSKNFVGKFPGDISNSDYRYILNDKDIRSIIDKEFPWIL